MRKWFVPICPLIRGSSTTVYIIYIPNVAISHNVTPNDHTSDELVNILSIMDSIAIHLIGSFPLVVLT